MKRLLFSGNTAWSMYNFRKEVLQACVKQGYSVFVAAPKEAHFQEKIEALGCTFIPIKLSAKSVNPFHDIALFFDYRKLLKTYQIDYCFLYTVKPNIYGSLAAMSLKIKHIPMVTGLGSAFIKKNFISALVTKLYKISFKRADQIWLLNEDDRQVFLENHIVPDNKITILSGGEGINLEDFPLVELPNDEPIFLLYARMLWDKGVGEFVTAARTLKQEFPNVRFQLLGFIGVDNPTAIAREQIDAWVSEGIIEYLGTTSDVRPMVQAASCIVLPSYREGMPLSLLEGGAMGRPLVATDVPGCKDIVDDGVNGFLCKAADSETLTQAMRKVICMTPQQRSEMGLVGYRKIKERFDVNNVILKYLTTLNPLRALVPAQTNEAAMNVSIVLYKNIFAEVKLLVEVLRKSPVVGTIFLIDNSKYYNDLYNSLPATYIFNNQNLGYGKGHNIALLHSTDIKVPYHLAINADIHFDPAILEQMIQFMDNNTEIGSLMPKVYYPDGKIQYLCRLLPSPIDLIGRRFLPSSWISKRIARLEMHDTDYNHLLDVPHISGCFMLLRTDTLRVTGLFDPRYFLYLEDIDLTRRMHNVSRTVFYPDASIIHEHHQGSYKNNHLLGVHIINAIRYFNKWGWFTDKERKIINNKTLTEANKKVKP